MSRIEQTNEYLRAKLAELINKEMPMDNALITITNVNCSADLKNARVDISVLPHNRFGSALERLKKHTHIFSQVLQKETKMRKVPRLHWRIDNTEKKAAEIEKFIADIKNEEE